MYGHERSLVQRYQDRPFVLLGVNTDADAATLKQIQEKQHLPWRSWYDGPDGPICKEWRILGFPSIFVIDAKGVVRYQHVGPPGEEELEREIETLLHEVPNQP
jgi:peroxiredoxin